MVFLVAHGRVIRTNSADEADSNLSGPQTVSLIVCSKDLGSGIGAGRVVSRSQGEKETHCRSTKLLNRM